MHRIALIPLAAALALATAALPTHAQERPAMTSYSSDGTLVSVSAQATSKRVPDVANISTGVVTQATDANTAMRQNAERMAKVTAAIKSAGIESRDIQTSGVNLNAQYKYEQGKSPTITGYEARNTVSVKVRDIGRLGKVMDSLVAAGANDLNGPSFEVDEPDAAYDEARRAALDKARARADMYAQALGLRVRRIVSIDEGTGGIRTPMPMMRAMAADAYAGKETSIEPGETSLSANLNVVFELGR